ncbi:MAG TPA: hypothetical protein VM870_01275 [Pyrinomonadaceae bacterium]|jgi:hypothetical protein|nr:hypothetical protein [Pyrinomonadaceae bacterium]
MENETPSSPVEYQKEKEEVLRENPQQPNSSGQTKGAEEAGQGPADDDLTGDGTGARAGEYS